MNYLNPSDNLPINIEPLGQVLGVYQSKNNLEILQIAIAKLFECDIVVSHRKHGHILKKLIRIYHRLGGFPFTVEIEKEFAKLESLQKKFEQLFEKYQDKSSEWWRKTHEIHLEDFI